MNLKEARRIHMVGIKGVGMTALAQLLNTRSVKLTGSDSNEKFFTDKVLKKVGIKPKTFAKENISKDIDLVVSSAAYFMPSKIVGKGKSIKNEEVERALELGIPVFSYPQALGEFAKDYKLLAVAGSHGKSTTSAMLAWSLQKAGFSPSAVIGTRVNGWESNGRVGKGEYLVVEADEYREAFLNYSPYGLIITNIDYDHPDYYKGEAAYNRAFKRIASKVDKHGFVVGFGDDPKVAAILSHARNKGLRTASYGFLKRNTLVLNKGKLRSGAQHFTATLHGKKLKGKIAFPGKHYIENAGAVLACSSFLDADSDDLLKGIASFKGTARRFEILHRKPALIIDDYAHHPSEIKATLMGTRELYPKKNIVVIFQPHMFSRTESLMDKFARAFELADEVGIMEIFSSARESKGNVSSKDLVRALNEHHSRVRYLKDHKVAKQFLNFMKNRSNNVVLLMGAGDVYEIAN
ncbi:MAG: UDP-N-acetylmuramate--L-alanine ligase [bacterium]|nr:UDP-N-acetylmuramate--L-alanine ligase [bacterium]